MNVVGVDVIADARRRLVRWTWGYDVIVVSLVCAAWDMVFKPGL